MTPRDDWAALERLWSTPPGFWGRLAAINSQVIGLRFMVTAAAFFLLAAVMALLMRVQLAVPENDFLSPQVYNQLFTMHGSTMMFLFIVPFLEGLAVYLLPLIIGSRDLAFPRLSAFGYWTYLFGGLMLYSSFLIGQVPDAGWFAYTPLSGPRFSGVGLDIWLLGLGLVEIGGITAAAEIVVTVLKLRAPGMALARMPLFAWAWLVTAVMILFSFTTLFIATLLLELDRSIGTAFFDPARGGSSLLWQHLFWFFGHPEVYIMFLPATGIVSMIVPVFARRPIKVYNLLVVAMVVMGFVSFGLWAHHMFTTGMPMLSLAFFTAASLAIAVTAGTQIFAWIGTLWGTRPALTLPLLYVLGFIVIFVLGGMTGVMVAVVPFDLQVHDTYFVVAHFHYVLIGGVVFPLLGGLHYWLPKLTGRLLGRRLGLWAFGLIVVGFNVTFFPMHMLGLDGMPRRVYTYQAGLGLEANNMIVTAGTFVLLAGLALFALDVALALRRGAAAPANPWGAGTLEWAVSSPPPVYNFARPPIARGREPLWDGESLEAGSPEAERLTRALARSDFGLRLTGVTSVLGGTPQAVLVLPFPSLIPLAVTLALLVASVGAAIKLYLLVGLGLLVAAGLLVAWLWPRRDEIERVRASGLAHEAGVPAYAVGTASVSWWGVVCLLSALATIAGALLFSYCYLWLYAEAWPQDGLPLPDWRGPGAAYGALVAAAIASRLATRASARGAWGAARVAWGAVAGLGLAFLGALAAHLAALGYGAGANAYASAFWVLSALVAIAAAVGVALALAVLVRLGPASGPEAGLLEDQVAFSALYGYGLAALALVVYATLYVAPRVLG